MLTITHLANDPGGVHLNEVRWGSNESKPYIKEGVLSVQSVAADGLQLARIRREFANIPMHDGDYVVWVGDIARLIYANLR